MNREELIGKKFNRLTVLSVYQDDRRVNKVKYHCICDFGNTKNIFHANLIYNKSKSCGCLRDHINRLIIEGTMRKIAGTSTSLNLFKCYTTRARNMEILFNLSIEKFIELTKLDCYYCGAEPKNRHRIKSKNKEWEETNTFIYNGLDRIDSNKGYTIDNIVTCCKICNTAKMDHTQEEFILWLKRISERYKK